jgi:5'-3' exonuclease
MSSHRLLLLDTASLYFRAFFGVPESMRAPDGTPVNAVRGLLDFIARLTEQYAPTHLACCWDDDWRPAWRVDLIPTYKAHRVLRRVTDGVDIEETPPALVSQIPVIREVLSALGIAIVGAPGCEADDVIGTLATGAGMPVDIVTGDRDLFQLVDDDAGVRVLYTARGVGRHEVVNEAFVVRKYGVLPQQYADLATLRGDTSDGLPGVAGIGEKTAASLLAKHGDLQSIVIAARDASGGMSPGLRGKIAAASDYLEVAPRVVAVRRDIDLDRSVLARPRPAPADAKVFEALSERWGLGSAAERVVAALRAEGTPLPLHRRG